MGVDVSRCWPVHRPGELSCVAWLSLHVLLYLGLGTVGLALLALSDGIPMAELAGAVLIGLVWACPLVVVATIAASFCLGVLRMLTEVRWYWFRLTAVLLFAVPFPVLLFLGGAGPEVTTAAAAVQLLTALLIVQPREMPSGWANRDPSIEDHYW